MSTVLFSTDHDPYPAKAGNTMVNDGSTARTFSDLRSIPSADLTKIYTFDYKGGDTVVDDPQPVTFPKEYGAGVSRPGISISGSAGQFTCPTISGVQVSGTAGQFTCTGTNLRAGDRIKISGSFSSLNTNGSITGYPTTTVYEVDAITSNGLTVTGFTLTLVSGDQIVTSAGTTDGLVFTRTISLKQNDRIAISGLLGSSTAIQNYGSSEVYLVTAVTGTSPDVTGFTLKTTENVALTTAVPSAVTFDPDGTVNTLPVLDISTDTIPGSNSKIRFAAAHNFNNLAEVTYTKVSGSNLTNLVSGTKYFIKRHDANTVSLYTSLVNASNADTGNNTGIISFTAADASNTGTHTLTATLSELSFVSRIFDPEPLATLQSHAVGITSNGVLILPPGTRDHSLMRSGSNTNASTDYTWNVVHKRADFNLDLADGKPMLHTGDDSNKNIYCYRSGAFLDDAWNNTIFQTSAQNASTYYSAGLTHSDGHSKIIGIAFDGYPIYGNRGYSNAQDKSSTVISLKSYYATKPTPGAGRGYTYENQSAGSFIEDYEQRTDGLENLDEHNGRFCVTPDFPNGTYAYFVTDEYPYIIGPSTKAQRSVTIT